MGRVIVALTFKGATRPCASGSSSSLLAQRSDVRPTNRSDNGLRRVARATMLGPHAHSHSQHGGKAVVLDVHAKASAATSSANGVAILIDPACIRLSKIMNNRVDPRHTRTNVYSVDRAPNGLYFRGLCTFCATNPALYLLPRTQW
jgi:hypothetical protein